MTADPYRERLSQLLRRNKVSMKGASAALGRNPAYLHQYLTRGSPRVLARRDTEALAGLLDCEPGELRHPAAPQAQPLRRKRRHPPAGTPVGEIPELLVDLDDPEQIEVVPRENPRWYLPLALLEQEGRADPKNFRIVSVRGDAMEPVLGEGDRLVVDTSRIRPTTGELCVRWDGSALAVARVEIVTATEPAQVRFQSANPDYSPVTCAIGQSGIVGTVLWLFRRP